ncbi:peptide-N-glycosidase F-related protein [Hymenobacter sp. M29]|uniref:Peptide-N-glycosidase F-related protein n=1 Tax=Hymenobacter mellowenesis TaxID=3063995 RepID=A0ABT9ADB7_9BACT|nr:peptide-N-glycosidase F-related protein [Hymenobacter sp. M29]MDO7847838.1 peptide-N-glycosidase F-related protein [Hymenobacter sp. M29]
MKKHLLLFWVVLLALARQPLAAQTAIRIFSGLLYYDGYATTVTTPPAPTGVTRLRNDLYARPLSTTELQTIGTQLSMRVTVAAACDNYDRIGNVNLALVPKGATTYVPANVPHIELGRYITPFMDKNLSPSSVSYDYDISNVAALLKETSLNTQYDFWVELQLFGVPYAANTQISGCAGRNDVFYGSLVFTTDGVAAAQSNNVLLPLLFQASLNNYQTTATDTLGRTTRTVTVNVPANLTDAALFLITSNHGANSGGEEYNRRVHYAYFDNVLRLSYTPGRVSCEPFRQYNTQGNGIYGPSPRTNAQWQSFSNWCPGDVIDIRRINLGAVSAGTHSFRIRVPTAVFAAGQGDIPTSVYLQGKTSGTLSTLAGGRGAAETFFLFPNPSAGLVTLANPTGALVREVVVRNALGQVVHRAAGSGAPQLVLSLGSLAAGTYVAEIHTADGVATRPFQVAR